MNQGMLDFDGVTYDPEQDGKRLCSLFGRVFDLMMDGKWRTLSEIRQVVGGSEAGISARLRDFRKEKHGNYTVERRRRGHPSTGLHEYKLRV